MAVAVNSDSSIGGRVRKLILDVPRAFWTKFAPTVLHFRRVCPGELEKIPTRRTEAFLRGAGSLRIARGWHELLEVRLEIKDVDGDLGIQPRLHLRRVPVDDAGQLDRAVLRADNALPDAERRAKHGWSLNDEEHAQFRAAMDRLVDSNPLDSPWGFEELFVGPNALIPLAPQPSPSRRTQEAPRARSHGRSNRR